MEMTTGSIPDREIFSIGTWRGNVKVQATQAMLAEMASAYAELNSKVSGFAIPIKLGHNKRVGEPAFGYAENVRMSEDGNTLLADFMDVPLEIVDAIKEKRYNTVSVEVWPSVTFDGKTYPNVLGGVALLGAEWPAVKGLKPLSQFSEDEQPIQLSKEDEMPKTFSEQEYNEAVAALEASHTSALTALTQRAERAEAALANFQDEQSKAEVTAVIEQAEQAGKIVPATKPAILAMAEVVRASVDPTKRTEAMKTFKEFVTALPVKVDLSEQGKNEQREMGSEANAATRLDAAAKKLLSEKKAKDYREACDMVFAADPALKQAYAEENV